MPSGLSTAAAGRVLDKLVGAGADTSLLATTIYLDALTTEADDDDGGGAVSWGQGRTAVTTTSATVWPSAASARQKTSAQITLATNSSGSTISIVALGWYTASSGGTYLGGAPVPDGSLDVPDGSAPVVTAILTSPPPS